MGDKIMIPYEDFKELMEQKGRVKALWTGTVVVFRIEKPLLQFWARKKRRFM